MGQRVELRLTAIDRKHGVRAEAIRNQTELPEGRPVIFRFVANQHCEFASTAISFVAWVTWA